MNRLANADARETFTNWVQSVTKVKGKRVTEMEGGRERKELKVLEEIENIEM